MIISHKHKFIFIKTEKTAGTSMEIALSSICGPDDIITPISADDEEYRKSLGFRTKQNFKIPIKKYSAIDFLRALRHRRRLEFYNHMSAIKIKDHIENDQWNEYFKFTLERNPFDKLISLYYWRGGKEKYPTILDFINSGLAAKIRGFELYTENSEVIVDKIYKFEELDFALSDFSEKIGLDEVLQLPERKAKGNVRKNKSSYREILSSVERGWVEKTFARELTLFDYQF